MFLYKNKIAITGGSGRFGSELKKIKNKYNLLYPNKTKLNILNLNNIKKYLKKEFLQFFGNHQMIPLKLCYKY